GRVESVRAQGRDDGATGLALDSGISGGDVRDSRRETPGTSGRKHRGIGPAAIVRRREEKNPRPLRRADSPARASVLVNRSGARLSQPQRVRQSKNPQIFVCSFAIQAAAGGTPALRSNPPCSP